MKIKLKKEKLLIMENKTYQDGVNYTWDILRKHQKMIFKEIARCEQYEHFTEMDLYKEKAMLIGNILNEIDEKRFIEEFDLIDSENRYDDVDDPNFNDGGDSYERNENDEEVNFFQEDIDIYKKTMQFKGRS